MRTNQEREELGLTPLKSLRYNSSKPARTEFFQVSILALATITTSALSTLWIWW